MKIHLAFARDFKEAGNEPMSRYHFEKAKTAYEKQNDAECGLFCSIIEALLDTEPDSISSGSCRDPVTIPPSGPPRC